ncbi:MAG: O-antigen ligase family protein [Flavobacteriales bacterium]|nr:O-antigen ligase family protein [Flavobacteriales bacterium]
MEGPAIQIRQISQTQWAIALLLVCLITFVVVVTESWWVMAIPAVLAVVYWAMVSLETLLLFTVALTPLSITLKNVGFNVGLSLPAELLLAGITLLILVRWLHAGSLPWKAIRHPIGVVLLLQVAWMFVTSLTSEMPLVSFKALIRHIWFVIPLYFFLVKVFASPRLRQAFFPLYAYPLALAAIYTLVVHAGYGFSKETSTWVSFPFYKEHTVYGMALAFVLPYAMMQAWQKVPMKPLLRMLAMSLFAVLLLAIVLSYTRAAWLSVIGAAVFGFMLRLGIQWKQMVSVLLLSIGMLWLTQSLWMSVFTKNDTVSSENFTEHVQSVSNISTDASNMERINRWRAAISMFQDRPLVGWGPGTYQFQYAPFQHASDLTVISTNGGDMGNAHSEYIGPLAEQGWPGLLLILVLVWTVFSQGSKTYHQLAAGKDKRLLMVALMGLATYFIHGFLNNFLDVDEGAVLVFGSCAMLVSISQTAKKLAE